MYKQSYSSKKKKNIKYQGHPYSSMKYSTTPCKTATSCASVACRAASALATSSAAEALGGGGGALFGPPARCCRYARDKNDFACARGGAATGATAGATTLGPDGGGAGLVMAPADMGSSWRDEARCTSLKWRARRLRLGKTAALQPVQQHWRAMAVTCSRITCSLMASTESQNVAQVAQPQQ